MQEEENTTQVEQNQNQTEEIQKQEEIQKSFEESIKELRDTYERKINDILLSKNKEIEERDNVIKQLLIGEENEEKSTIVEKLNEKRIFKKW